MNDCMSWEVMLVEIGKNDLHFHGLSQFWYHGNCRKATWFCSKLASNLAVSDLKIQPSTLALFVLVRCTNLSTFHILFWTLMGRCQTDKVLLAHNETSPHRLKPPTTDICLLSSLYIPLMQWFYWKLSKVVCVSICDLSSLKTALKRNYRYFFFPDLLHFNWIYLLHACAQ